MKLIFAWCRVWAPGSPPARGRGLKLKEHTPLDNKKVSPPARGRGLKHPVEDAPGCTEASPPARGRGLKHLWLL